MFQGFRVLTDSEFRDDAVGNVGDILCRGSGFMGLRVRVFRVKGCAVAGCRVLLANFKGIYIYMYIYIYRGV